MKDRRLPASQARLDNPERPLWLPLQPGETIADAGAGTGYFSMHVSKAVGTRGKQ